MKEKEQKQDKIITGAFDVSVLLKGIDGILEIIVGIVLLVIPLERISSLLIWLTRSELQEDNRDLVANYLVHLARSLSVAAYDFTIIYLLLHGIVKVFLVVMLLRKKLWAYPLAIVVFAIFGIYQLYQYSINSSILLLLLTFLDIIVIALTWLEYRILTRGQVT